MAQAWINSAADSAIRAAIAVDGPLRRALRGEEFDDLELIVRRPGPDQVRWVLAKARPLRDPDGRVTGPSSPFVTSRNVGACQELKDRQGGRGGRQPRQGPVPRHPEPRAAHPADPGLARGLRSAGAGPTCRPEVRPTLEMIRRNVELEARLIDDLLDLTRTSGRLTLSLGSVDAHRLIQQAVEICRREIKDAGLELGLDLGARQHHVKADPTRLQQVFWNLIKNAVKFTPRGGRITIRTRNSTGEIPAGKARLSGPRCPTPASASSPTPARDLQRVRAKGPASVGGSTAASGSAWRSAGRWSRPTAAASPPPAPARIAARRSGSSWRPSRAPASMLPRAMRASASMRMESDRRGCESSWSMTIATPCGFMAGLLSNAAIGRSRDQLPHGVEAGRVNIYDLLISDIELPDGTGLDIIRELHGRHPTPGIAVSGFGSADDVVLSLKSGFAEHLIKPIDVRELDAAIARRRGQACRDGRRPRAVLASRSPQSAPHDRPIDAAVRVRIVQTSTIVSRTSEVEHQPDAVITGSGPAWPDANQRCDERNSMDLSEPGMVQADLR